MGEKKTFGQRMAEVRDDLGMTQPDLSKASGLSVTFISELENGRREPGMKRLSQLANALGVSIDWLVFGEDRPSDPLRKTVTLDINGVPTELSEFITLTDLTNLAIALGTTIRAHMTPVEMATPQTHSPETGT